VIVSGTLIGELVSREGKQLSIKTSQGDKVVLSLFEDFVEFCPEAAP
jgi:hypothetical protein